MPHKSAEDRKAYKRRQYLKNKEYFHERLKRRRKERREWFDLYKANLLCSACGEDHPATLDFHHRGDDKKEIISVMVADAHSVKNILAEIEKCIVLCSNCHRKFHWGERSGVA